MVQLIQIKPETNADYVLEGLMEMQRVNETMSLQHHLLMVTQANLVLESIMEGKIVDTLVTEAGPVKTATGAVKKGTTAVHSSLKRLIEFIKNVFGRFKDFISTAFQNNEKWLLEREKDFDTMNYSGLGISMVPYWEGKNQDSTYNQIYNRIKSFGERADRDKEFAQKYVTDEGKLEVLDPYVDGDNNAVNGIKNVLRVNNKNGLDAVELRENELKNKIISEFIPYVKGHAKLVAAIDRRVKETERLLDTMNSELRTRNVNATESFIEGIKLSDTDLMFCENFQVLLEAENAEGNKKQDDGKTKDSTQGNTKVEVLDKKTAAEREQDEQIKSSSNIELRVATQTGKLVQLALTCYMTVAEERYSAYFNAIKAIYKEANTRHGRKGNTHNDGTVKDKPETPDDEVKQEEKQDDSKINKIKKKLSRKKK